MSKNNYVLLLLMSLFIANCSLIAHEPNAEKLLLSENCKHLKGYFSFDKQQIKNSRYQIFRDLSIYSYLAVTGSPRKSSFLYGILNTSLEHDKIGTQTSSSCDNSVLELDLENDSINDGGVIGYESIKLQIYSYDQETVYVRLIRKHVGLAFLIPFALKDDEVILLKRTNIQ